MLLHVTACETLSGLRKFCSSPKKDFLNTIGTFRTCGHVSYDCRDLGPVLVKRNNIAGSPAQRRQASARWMQDGTPAKFAGRHGAHAGHFLVLITTARSAQCSQYRKRGCLALHSALGCKMIHLGRNARTSEQRAVTTRKKSKPKNRHSKSTSPRSAGRGGRRDGKTDSFAARGKHISQIKLAGHLAVSFQQVQKYEKGINRIGAARLQQITAMLGVDIPLFYDGDGKGTRRRQPALSRQQFQPPAVARLHRHQRSSGAETACSFGRDDCGFSALIGKMAELLLEMVLAFYYAGARALPVAHWEVSKLGQCPRKSRAGSAIDSNR